MKIPVNVSEGISFGINEQIMTLLAAIGGLVNKKKNELVGLLLIFGFASALPDIYTFITNPTMKNKPIEKIVSAIVIFISELICVLLIGIPLMFVRNKKLMIFLTFMIGIILIIINELYFRASSISDTIETCIIAGILVIMSYLVSNVISKIFKIKM
jgi:hypothetical protein